jgi:asparagine synthetase B (glutamine-hydrolysing)
MRNPAKHNRPRISDVSAELRRRAEDRLRGLSGNQQSDAVVPKSAATAQRLLHELQVHQIELEMQNAELRQARDELEVALDNYTDLYDFAPAGYFTLTAAGTIRQVNLTGACFWRRTFPFSGSVFWAAGFRSPASCFQFIP